MNTHHSKIGRLPHWVRNALNERLERSEPSSLTLPWINGLEEVQEVIDREFEGAAITKQNLSEWRLEGGYQEWLARLQLFEEACSAMDQGRKMETEETEAGAELIDRVVKVLAMRYASLIAKWDGEMDDKFLAKVKVLNDLNRSVVQLQRSIYRARREKQEIKAREAEREKAQLEETKERMTAPIRDLFALPSMREQFGGGKAGEKIARYVMAVQRGNVEAELDLKPEDVLDSKARRQKPTAPPDNPGAGPEEASPGSPAASSAVQPNQANERTAQE